MKRKNLYISSFLAMVIALGLTSCSDSFLELQPITSTVEANYYQTEAQANLAVVAIYDSYQGNYSADVVGMSEAFSDNAFGGGDTPKDLKMYVEADNTAFLSENGDVIGLYRRCYEGIYRANIFLEKSQIISYSNASTKVRLEAEAKFLRGYMYWDLARHYGWVPVLTKTVSPLEAKSIPQSTPSEVYTQVVTDLLAALPGLPESVSGKDYGRISKGACRALIARVYLYYTGISKISGLGLTSPLSDGVTTIDQVFASKMLADVIASGKYKLQSNYLDVFKWDNQANSEIILAQRYSSLGLSGWDGVGNQGSWQGNGNILTQRCGVRDPKPNSFTAHGWSGLTVSWDLVAAYGPKDTRISATVFDATKELTSYTKRYENTGYFNRKYMSQAVFFKAGGDPVLNWARDLFDIRYSDVLLMAAELNVDGKGLEYFNLVHERAGNDPVASITQDDILKERRLEFGGEGLRKWDLLRTGLDYAAREIARSFANVPANWPNAADFSDHTFYTDAWGMMPIPSAEIRNTNVGVLKQYIPYYIGK